MNRGEAYNPIPGVTLFLKQDGSTVYIEVEGGRLSWTPPLSPNGLQTVDLRRSSALDLGEVAAAIEEVEGGEARHLERLMVRLQSRARGYLVRHADHFCQFLKGFVELKKNSVVDSYSLNQYPDLDPVFVMNPDPDPDPGF